MTIRNGNLFYTLVLAVFLLPSLSSAATVPVEAHAVYVEGEVSYVSIEDAATHPVEVNTPFREGDRVITGADGKVEIEFDTGALLLLDNDTGVTLRSLHRDEGVMSAIFDLAAGMIKSSFSKLLDNDVIEYQTRSATTGVGGTPEHVIQADTTADGTDRTNVYLLGEEGDEGSLYVRGFDPDKTEVILSAGMGTTVLAGLAPLAPFVLGPEILQSIGHMISRTGGAAGTSVGAGSRVKTGGVTISPESAAKLAGAAGAAAVTALAANMGGGGEESVFSLAPSAGVTGRWAGDVTFSDGDGEVHQLSVTLDLIQAGATVSGTGALRDTAGGSITMHRIDGEMEGNSLRASILISDQDREDPNCQLWDLQLAATVSRDTMIVVFEGSACGGNEQAALITESRGILTRQ